MIHALAMSAKIGITAALTGSTMAATAAQMGYNGALYACPIVWICRSAFEGQAGMQSVLCSALTAKSAPKS